jgi:DNA repair exonuclease SbcCD ATPase subunit
MKFEKLLIRNFLSVGNKTQKVQFKEGINLLSGTNGKGKSTAIKALKLILFNNVGDKKSKTELINWDNKKNMFVELHCSNGTDNIIIGRSAKCKEKDDFYLIKNDEVQEVTDEKSFTQMIHKLLRVNPKIASQTIFLDAEFYVPFLSLTKDKKRDFIRPIFDLMKYDTMKEAIKADIKVVENNLNESTQNISILEQKKETLHNTIENQRNALRDDLTNRESTFEMSLKDLKQLEKEKEDFEQPDCEKVEQENKSLKDKMLQCEKAILKRESELEKVESAKNLIKVNESDLQRKNVELNTLESKVLTKPTSNLDINKIEDRIQSHVVSVSELENESKTLEKANSFYLTNDECKECGQLIDDEFKSDQLRNNNIIIERNNDSISKLSKDLERLNDHKKDYSIYLSELNNYEKENLSLENTKSNLKQHIERTKTAIEHAKGNIVDVDQDYIKKLNKGKSKLQTMISKNNEVIQSAKKIEQEYNQMCSNVDLKKQEINTHKERIAEIKRSMEKLSNDTQVEDVEKEIKAVNVIVEEKKSELEKLNNLVMCVGDNGIKKYIIGKSVPFLNKIAKEYCEAINSKFMIKFNKNGLDVDVTRRGKGVSYWSLSSGQRQRLNLVIMFVFIQFIKRKTQQTFPAIFLDEILNSSLDSEGIEDLFVILKELRNDIPYIWLISHNDDTKTMCDNEIKVEMNGRFTNYTEV